MNGLLVYSENDIEKNSKYISWLINEGKKRNMKLNVSTDEFLQTQGIDSFETVDFVINRSRSYEISLLFELNDIRVFNNSDVTLIGNNKLAAYKYAKNNGFKFPKVLIEFLNKKQVLSKPNDGHGGEGIHLIEASVSSTNRKHIKQEFIEDLVGDIRFYVINNEIISSVIRFSDDKIISNYSQGGKFRVYKYSKSEEDLIKRFMKGINFDYVGLDFFLTKKDELIFNEIEDVVGSRMLSHLGINNTTELYLEHIYRIVEGKKNTK